MTRAAITVCVICLAVLFGCSGSGKMSQKVQKQASAPGCTSRDKTEKAELIFSIKLNNEIYRQSDWGEPPQIAIWLESPDGSVIRTVFVTYRAGFGHWVDKVECPVALPYWISRWNRETKTTGAPSFNTHVPDAVTGATPKLEFTASTRVKPGSDWFYFIEVNVSGDFNKYFPSMRKNGEPDPQGNGQPSIVYKGQINAANSDVSTPQIIGRTEQWQPVDYLIADMNGITTAKALLSEIRISCRVLQ